MNPKHGGKTRYIKLPTLNSIKGVKKLLTLNHELWLEFINNC